MHYYFGTVKIRRALHSTLKPARKTYCHLQFVARLCGTKQPVCLIFKEQEFCLTFRDEVEALTDYKPMGKVIFLGCLTPVNGTGMLLGICDAQLPSYEAEHRGIAKTVTIPWRKPEISITRIETVELQRQLLRHAC